MPSSTVPVAESPPTSAMRGILVGLAIAVPFWLALAEAVRLLFPRIG